MPGSEPERIQLCEKGGGPLRVGTICEQETFGEVSILYRNVVATETVRTRTHTVMLFVARNEFQNLLTLCPELKTRLELRYKMGKEAVMKQQKTIEAIMRHYARIAGLRRNTNLGVSTMDLLGRESPNSLAASEAAVPALVQRRSSLGDQEVVKAHESELATEMLNTRSSVA